MVGDFGGDVECYLACDDAMLEVGRFCGEWRAGGRIGTAPDGTRIVYLLIRGLIDTFFELLSLILSKT